MSECEKCIRAQDQRDPWGAPARAKMRALMANLGPRLPVWDIPVDPDSEMTCIDCPACGGHWLVGIGETWCANCVYELGQVERHTGPPVETGFTVGDVVINRIGSIGRVRYVDPSGFVDMLIGGWSMRMQPEELRRVRPRASYVGDVALGLQTLPPDQYPKRDVWARPIEWEETP